MRAGRAAKHRLVVSNLGLVMAVAKRYYAKAGASVPHSDLIQEGVLGLMRATDKFDATKGFRFSTYATWWIRQAIGRAVAYHSRTIRIPVHMQDTRAKVRRAATKLGPMASDEDVAAVAGVTVATLHAARDAVKDVIPLDRPLGDGGLCVADVVESHDRSPEQIVETSLLRDDLAMIVNSLHPGERDVVRLRFGLDDGQCKSVREIAGMFGLTAAKVRQVECRALRKLRHPFRANLLRHYALDDH